MGIVVRCEECGKKYNVRNDMEGSEIPCKECGADIYVEAESPRRRSSGRSRNGGGRSRGSDSRRSSGPSRAQRRRQHTPNNPKTALWIAGGIGSVVILGVIIALVIAFGGDDKDDNGNQNVAANQNVPGDVNQPRVNNNNRGRNQPPPFNAPPFNPPDNNNNANNGGGNNNPPPFVPPANNNPPAGNPGAGFAGNPQPIGQQPDVKPGNGGGGLQPGEPLNIQAFDKPEVWNVAADPPEAIFEVTQEEDFSINLPDAFASTTIMFPTMYSPVVSLGDNSFDKSVRQIWNFATGKKLSSLGGVRLSGSKFAVSPDGTYLAAVLHGGKGPRVIDMAESKDLGELPVAERVSFVKVLDFAGPDRLLCSQSNDPIKVWKIPSGDLEREITLPDGWEDKSLTFSPGGRYMAITETRKSRLYLIDLDSGANAGITPLPTTASGSLRCQSMRFSQDGTELLGLFDVGSGSRLVVWNMASGEVSEQVEFKERVASKVPNAYSYKGPAVEWFPAKKRWLLYGAAVVDRKSKKIIWTIPETDRSTRRILDENRILAGMDINGKKVLTTYTLPEEKITQAQEILESGGTLEDAGLPKLTPADRKSVKVVSKDGAGAAWQVPADPAPTSAEPLMSGALNLRSSTGTIQSLLLSRAEGGKAVLMYLSGNLRSQAASAKVWLESYDVKTQEHAHTLQVQMPSELLAISPNGDKALMRLAGAGERLDLWKIEDGAHVAAWRPYMQPTDNTGMQMVGRRNSQTDQTVTAAAFLDDDHVLTLNRKNELVMWQLPECKAIYSIESAGKPGLSPGGKLLVISNGKNFRFFHALTGEVAGDLPIEGSLQAAAFHPDGKKFAVVLIDAEGTHLVCWDLAAGKVTTEFPIPLSAQSMQWTGDNYILFDNGMLIDIGNKLAAWKYQLTGGVRSPLSPNENLWYLLSQGRGGNVTLVSATVPEKSVDEYLRTNEAQISPDHVIKPGDEVSVMINLRDPPGEPNFRSRVYKNIIDKYSQNNIKVSPNKGVVVNFYMEHSNTGETEEYEIRGRFGLPERDVSVAVEKVVVRINIMRDGQQAWERRIPFSNSGGFFIRVPDGKSIQQHLTDQMWKSASSSLLGFNPPAYVFGPKATEGLGRSTLTSSGINTIGR